MKNVFKSIAVALLSLFFMSADGCDYLRENYEFATGASIASPSPSPSASPDVSPTATPAVSPTPEPDDDDDTESPTPSPTPTPTPEVGTQTVRAGMKSTKKLTAQDVLESLQDVADKGRDNMKTTAGQQGEADVSNWLGQSYADEGEEDQAVVPGVDSDGDGFTDELEQDAGTGVNDPTSYPDNLVTSLAARLSGLDDDVDGLENRIELERGTDPQRADTDQDGYADGAEILSNADPLDEQSQPYDSDGDGLADQYENGIGTDPKNPDTDGDLLRDDLELAVGSNPLERDTDFDGIYDGTEVALGSDPVVSEFQQ